MRKKESPKRTNLNSPNRSSSQGDEYDLKNNLNNINSYSKCGRKRYKPSARVTVTSEGTDCIYSGKKFANKDIDMQSPTKSGGMSWEEYARLDDKLSSFRGENDKAHTDLRLELEQKIKEARTDILSNISSLQKELDKYIPWKWLAWTASLLGSVIVIIVTIWYNLSYCNVHPLPQTVNEIEKRVYDLEKRTVPLDSIDMNKKKHGKEI